MLRYSQSCTFSPYNMLQDKERLNEVLGSCIAPTEDYKKSRVLFFLSHNSVQLLVLDSTAWEQKDLSSFLGDTDVSIEVYIRHREIN